jgi:hypothetical protein
MSHHLQALRGVEEAEIVLEAPSRLRAEGHLFRECRCFERCKAAAEFVCEAVRGSLRAPRERVQRCPAGRRGNEAGPGDVHGVSGQAPVCSPRGEVLCLDFDDTIVLDNTMRQILEHFADPSWVEVEERYRRGELSVEHNVACLDLVEAGQTRFGPSTEVAPARRIRELADWAHWSGWLVAVVSNGFDLYVDPVLDDLGLDRLARTSGVRARSTAGVSVT